MEGEKLEEKPEKRTIIKLSEPSNTKSVSKTLGEVELKFVSLKDLGDIAKLLRKIKDGREFTANMLHHQLFKPDTSLKAFEDIPDGELEKIGRDLITGESDLFKYFKEATGPEFFNNFRKAIGTYYRKRADILRVELDPVLKSVRRTAEAFNKQYASLLSQRIQVPRWDVELGKTISNLARKIEIPLVSISESARLAFQQFESYGRTITEAIRPQIEFWQKWADQNREVFVNFQKYWENFQKKYKITEAEAVKILKKYKWLITPSLPINFVFAVVKVGNKKGNQRGALNKLFVGYFLADNCKNLESLVEGWKDNQLFKSRMKILRDCVSVIKHAKGKYNPFNSVLPTLIAQIDGIRIDFMSKNGLGFWSKDKKWKTLFESQTSNEILMDIASDVFLNILFQKSDAGKPLDNPFYFNRHKILHGESVKYGRVDHTIRAFLILDFLASLK